MSRSKHPKMVQEEEGGGEGAPIWIISFADMISLLMAFFVMLSTFSAFDKDEKLKYRAVANSTLLSFGGAFQHAPKDSLSWKPPANEAIKEGPERPSPGQNLQVGVVRKTAPDNYLEHKVFLISTSSMFYFMGNALTIEGRFWLDTMVKYLGRVQGKVLISERGPGSEKKSKLKRSIVAAEYLIEKGVPADRLCVSSCGTMPQSYFQQKKMLEFCILEQNICP